MKNPLVLVLLLLALGGCSGGKEGPTDYGPHPSPGGVNEDLAPYVEEFESIYNLSVNYAVLFDDESETGGANANGGTTVGVCRVWSDGRREVLVNREWWQSKGTIPRRLLIYHELGHCSFDRDHDCRSQDNPTGNCANFNNAGFIKASTSNRPFSIMYPILNPIIAWYPSLTNYFLAELPTPGDGTVYASGYEDDGHSHGFSFEEEKTGEVKVKEFHSLGSSHSDHVGCEGHDKTYVVEEEK